MLRSGTWTFLGSDRMIQYIGQGLTCGECMIPLGIMAAMGMAPMGIMFGAALTWRPWKISIGCGPDVCGVGSD